MVIDFLQSLDVDHLRVRNFPSYIFLCGGSLQSSPGDDILSARAFYYSHLQDVPELAEKIILAEQISEWFERNWLEDKLYDDLLAFETDLAELSSLTLLFVESPGSIAELGAFSTLKPINDRLFIILQRDKSEQPSFINRGPVLRVQRMREEAVCIYEWDYDTRPKPPISFTEDSAKDLTENISSYFKTRPAELKFKRNKDGHLLLFIAQLIRTCRLSLFSEIKAYLGTIEVEIEDKRLRQFLYILESLDMISTHRFGRYKFYTSRRDYDFVRYSFKSTAKYKIFDAWLDLILTDIRSNDTRLSAYREILQKECD